MNWKRVISGVLAAAMLSALPVQLPVSAEGIASSPSQSKGIWARGRYTSSPSSSSQATSMREKSSAERRFDDGGCCIGRLSAV